MKILFSQNIMPLFLLRYGPEISKRRKTVILPLPVIVVLITTNLIYLFQ